MFELVKNWVLISLHIKIHLLLIDMNHFFGESRQFFFQINDISFVFFNLLLILVLLVFVNLLLGIINLFLEVSLLFKQPIFDFSSVLSQFLITGFNDLDNFINIAICDSHWFLIIVKLSLTGISVKHHEPFNHFIVLSHEFLLFYSLNSFKFGFKIHEELRVLSFLCEVFFDLFDISRNIWS